MEQNFNGYEGVNVTLPPQKQRKSGLAIASLILGIVSLVGLCCCGINLRYCRPRKASGRHRPCDLRYCNGSSEPAGHCRRILLDS